MKIAIFADPYLDVAGGITSSIESQKTELKKLGHEVRVFCPGQKSDDPDVVIVPTSAYLKFGGSWTARWPEIVMEWVEENYPDFDQFDIVHAHYEAGCSIAGMLLARKYHIPLVQTMHGREDVAIATNVPKAVRWSVAQLLNSLHSRYIPEKVKVAVDDYLASSQTTAEMWSLMVNHANFADLVITPTQHFQDKLKHYGAKTKMAVISNGIPDQVFDQFPERRHHWDGKRPLEMIWNSRASREKRLLPFLQALAALPRECDFRLHVYGDGNELDEARELIREKRLGRKVKLYGRVSLATIWEKLGSCDLSVVNSYGFDTQSLVLLEAEVAGVPTIFCDPDMRGVVPKGGGIYVDGPEVEKMTAALRGLWAEPQRIEQMSKVMFGHRESLRQSALVKKLLREYQKLSYLPL